MTTGEEAIMLAREVADPQSIDPVGIHESSVYLSIGELINLIDLAKQKENEACVAICAELVNNEENTDEYQSGAAWCGWKISARMKP
jgi:hypothetical protein